MKTIDRKYVVASCAIWGVKCRFYHPTWLLQKMVINKWYAVTHPDKDKVANRDNPAKSENVTKDIP